MINCLFSKGHVTFFLDGLQQKRLNCMNSVPFNVDKLFHTKHQKYTKEPIFPVELI